MTFRILAISGSLRSRSANTALLEALPQIVPAGVQVTLYQGLAALPHFNPDVEDAGLPPAVADLRARVDDADAIVISSPEYAHGVPGVLKNALDWLVGGTELPGKRVALLNTSLRSTHAQASLTEILSTMAAVIVPDASITVPLLGRDMEAGQIATDPDFNSALRAAIVALMEAGVD